jgi:hypothetical protein
MGSNAPTPTKLDTVRISDLSRGLGIKAKAVIDLLPIFGVTEKKTHSSSIPGDVAERIRERILGQIETRSLLKSTSEANKEVVKADEKPSGLKSGDSLRLGLLRAPDAAPAIRLPRPSELALPALSVGPPSAASAVSPPVSSPIVSSPIVSSPRIEPFLLQLPRRFTFHRGFLDFDYIFDHFDWTLKDVPVLVDLTTCESSNYQALALLIQYAWFLTINGCRVTFKYGVANSGPTKMLNKMRATDWQQVLTTDGKHFGNRPGQMLALRRRSDVQNAINTARRAIQDYKVGFPDYLSYIVSELLYNSTEHGCKQTVIEKCHVVVPSIFQFGRYPASERLVFFFSDLGIGIKTHLERAYPPFPTHQDAITYALRPNVSGTFNQAPSPYGVNNNAGMGLTYSSQMLKRLRGDMYIVSHNGMVHVSPEDVTSRSLKHSWPGTFVLVDLNVSDAPKLSLEDLLGDIRGKAQIEISVAEKQEEKKRYYVHIENYFGKWAEDKDAAIGFRDRRLIPAINEGKKIELDFRGVETAPHSFLNALLATPVKLLGMKAYQWIHVYNAAGSIHEIIRTIFETNLPELK